MVFTVTLKGGLPWGFRLQGGREFNEPIRIAKINPNSKAYNEGIQVGDYVEGINGQKARGLEHQEAQRLIKTATDELILELTRVSGKSNGTMNGDIHNHIDHELEILNSGSMKPLPRAPPPKPLRKPEYGHLAPPGSHGIWRRPAPSVWSPNGDTHQGKTYKPVSFGQRDGHSAHYSPMTGTSHMVRSRTAPASPVLQPRYRTAPTSPVMFHSVLKIPPLSPRTTHRALVSRLKAGSVSSVTSADETPPSGNPCYWSTTPPSSCSSTPPMRPRLPKHFKPTPFLPQASHDVTPTSKQSTSYTEASKPPFSPRSERRVLRPREMSPSTCSEEGGSDRSWSSSGAKDAKIAPMKKSKGLKLFRRMQKKLQSLGIPVKDEAPHQPSWQQTREAPPPPAARSVSGEERRGMPIPIRVETGHRAPSFGSPQSRSYSMDSPQSQPHYVVPPPRDFASGRSELPREIPVVFEGISQGLRNLRQAPVDQGQSQCVDYTGHSSPERGYRQEVPINRTGSQQSFVSPPVGQRLGQGQREIPIQIKTSVSDSGSKPDSPRQIRIEHERKKADLERKRVVLERDINNVINEAIKQVPVYNKPAQEKVEPSSASQEQNQDEIMEQKQMADRKQAMQTFWKAMEKQESDSEKPHQQTFGSGSYATLPVKKKSIEEQKPKPTYYETEAGSYSTLPSFRHKSKESPVLSHRQLVQQDRDYSFSDVEGGRGKAQPSWRPSGSPLQSRHVWKPIIPPKEIPDRSVTPEPKHLPVKEWRPLTGPEPPRRQESRSRPAQQEFTTGGQSQSQPQQSRGYIPIQIQYEQKPVRKVGEPAIEEGDSSLSSFDTADTSSEVRMNGTHAPTPPAKSPKPAVWSPGMQHSPSGSTHSERTPGVGTDSPTSSLKEVPQKWTPGGSALFAPKGYKPIKPDFTKTIDSRKISSTDKFIPKPEESYAWKPPNRSESESLPTSAFSYQQSPVSQTDYSSQPSDSQHTQPLHYNQSSANGNIYNASPTSQSSQPVSDTTSHVTSPSPRQRTISSSSGGRGEHHVSTSMVHLRDEPSRLPPSQSPYITLLQKNRENGYPRDIEFVGDPVLVTEEGKIPKGAIYLGKSESVEGDVRHTDSYYAVPTEDTPPVQAHSEMKVSSPKRYEDIGPIDQESGMPLSFRQNVEEEKQHDWYKQMYKSLHKGKRKEEYDTAENNYKPTYQFPEDEDKSDSKSVTVTSDKSRTASLSQYEDTGSAFVQRVEDARHFFELASPRSQPLSSKSSNISMSSPLSPKSPALSPKPAESSSTISTLSAEKTSPLSASSKSPSAISDSSSSRLATKNEKEDKPKSTLTSLSEKLRRDAKFSSGKQIKREEDRTQDIDIEVRAVPAKAVEHEDVNPYRPSYEVTNRALKADLDAGYRSEPEYRSKLRSKSTSGIGSVGKTARTLDIGTLPTDLEDFIKYLDGWSPPSARASLDVYRNQPRSIVDYEPGFSSIAFRESKTQRSERPQSYTGLSPAEREKLAKKAKLAYKRKKAGSHNPPPELPGQYSTYTEGRRRQISEPSTSEEVDPIRAYKQIQRGGEIPYKGLNKPAPEKSKKIQSQQDDSSLSSNEPIKTSETNHQPIIKSHTTSNTQHSRPLTKHNTNSDRTQSVYRTNGSIVPPSIPNPPVRNPLKISIPSSKHSRPRRRSLQSAAEQLGVKSPPPLRVNGVDEDASDSAAFHHLTTEEIRSQQPRWSGDRDQRRREEEESYRKRRLEQIYDEERRKKLIQQQADNESRKHSDFLLSDQQVPSQKSPIPNDRFEEPIGRYGAVPEDRRRGFQIQGKARGLYNFTAQNNRELPFRKGDTIYLIRQIDANWFEGEKGGRVGIFPVNYVEILTSIEEAQNAAQQSEGLARAKYSFTSQTSVELSLRKGETVTLLRKVDDNWFEGRHGAQQGIFPVAYVEVVREPSTPLVTPAPSVICTPMTGRGTPEMLSPMSYDGAPTPPPMPSPGAFKSSTLDRYNGSRYGSQQVSSPRQETQYGRDQFDSSPANRQYSQSPAGRQMNGGYSTMPNSSRRENVVARSSQSPQIIRRDNPPTVNITAKSVSSPNIHVNSHDHNRNIKQPEEDLALARYRAVYAYKPQNEDELELLENDEVYVMEKCDDGWYVGTSGRTGMFGTFPGNYVTRIQ
ncbi:serine/arginine repetitive matrix protein 2-like isoform X6 [Mya arenaria]|uniref:serine/arginine repetitive matrix protein 2-like isoform X6 n=1 Tax=Mya arenaria TaxID=6604 RepID=UPI0022E322B0|nr:serine/arginine repetitive matrix protein 2-like isoform X6 [Mya arenaria]